MSQKDCVFCPDFSGPTFQPVPGQAYPVCFKHMKRPPAPPAPCTHDRCEWANLGYREGWWIACNFGAGKQLTPTVACPDCGSKLPESGPRKVVGLWPEAVGAIRFAADETLSSMIRSELRAILRAAGEGEQ